MNHPQKSPASALNLEQTLSGRNLVVVGGTGFLGKVWCALLLSRFPDVGHLYLVVRPKEGLGVVERFNKKILTSEVFLALREKYGSDFDAFMSEKITPISGDISTPLCGLASDLRDKIRGRVDAVVNVAGVVDFDPPLDEALEVNAFGCKNLVALAHDLGKCPILHTSTCFTAGSRTGPIEELDPRAFPFPRAGELERSDWDPDREISECLDVIEQARHRASDAFRQSRFLDEAKNNLKAAGEPMVGAVLDEELLKVKRRFVEDQLADLGMERAQFWGWPNTYTYTKSLGEQIVAESGLPNTIVRPAIVESTMEFPFPGWNEGINTSSPIIFLIREGGLQVPGSKNNLDMIPCDMVCAAIILALSELLDGSHKPVYQAASSDVNPCSMARFFELSGLHKRRYYKKTGRGGPVLSQLASRFESSLLSKEQYHAYGPRKLGQGATRLSGVLKKSALGPLSALLRPAAEGLDGFAKQQAKLARVMDTFLPFIADYQYVFRTDNVISAYARLSDGERALLPWYPERIDWRDWFLNVHVPALERHVFPEMEKRLKRKVKAPRPFVSLTDLLDGAAERFDLKVALSRTEDSGLSRLSYRGLRVAAQRTALELRRQGIAPGDRVLLAGKNHPAWPVAFFGILYAGATVVPFDSTLDVEAARSIQVASKARLLIADTAVSQRLGEALGLPQVAFASCLTFEAAADEEAPTTFAAPSGSDALAVLIYTSGTTGNPKGVMLSHGNLTSLVASLVPLFPLGDTDRLLSVLPLHHTFELTCGLLLPLSRGSRIVYLDEVNAERLDHGFKSTRPTALIGVPALWELIERRIEARVAERGVLAEKGFGIALEVSRAIGKSTGVDVGRTLFGTVHDGLGGNLRYLVSGGAALGSETHSLFQGLGLHLAEGYGLTESAPVLTVAKGGPKARAGTVGHAVPGVEIRIKSPNAQGVGEVLARGPNVMLGYADDPEATQKTLDSDGWLHTGDLGKLDGRGRLSLVGRQKDVVVGSNGENIYPDDVEVRLGLPEFIEELSVLGVPDGRGGERLAICVVPKKDSAAERSQRHLLARESIDKAILGLVPSQRPAVVVVLDEKLPRTTTRKVKRSEVSRVVQHAAEKRAVLSTRESASPLSETVITQVATISRRKPSDVALTSTLRGDLGFDSLMALELLVALESRLGKSLDAEKLNQATTVGELVKAVEAEAPRFSPTKTIEGITKEPLVIPEPVRQVTKSFISSGQKSFYERVMKTTVEGRSHIPYNRRTLVVANHTSHLDMGLVKYALGSYGKDLVTLAAQDYFFEGDGLRKVFFEQLSNLEPMDRGGSLRASLRRAGEILDLGKTVLIFPEGTRSQDGALLPFKPAIGHLALHHNVDILPIYLDKTFLALPRGASVPRRREIGARIGPALGAAQLRKMVDGLSATDAARVVTRIAYLAVEALSRGQTLALEDIDVAQIRRQEVPEEAGLSGVFQELHRRFVPGAVEAPVSYYFSLGDERWTVRATPTELEVSPGKTVDQADCVLKTSPATFERIIRDAWVPGPADFMSGQIKTSSVPLLVGLSKLFQLTIPTSKLSDSVAAAEGATA